MKKWMFLALSLLVLFSCGGNQNNNPQLVVETIDGSEVRGPLAENLRVSVAIAGQSTEIILSTLDIWKIELDNNETVGFVKITTTHAEGLALIVGDLTGVILNENIILVIDDKTVPISLRSIRKLSMEW